MYMATAASYSENLLEKGKRICEVKFYDCLVMCIK